AVALADPDRAHAGLRLLVLLDQPGKLNIQIRDADLEPDQHLAARALRLRDLAGGARCLIRVDDALGVQRLDRRALRLGLACRWSLRLLRLLLRHVRPCSKMKNPGPSQGWPGLLYTFFPSRGKRA